MKTVYTGKYLTISHEEENNLFVQNWVKSPETLMEFENEMLVYTFFYKEYKPKYTLWLQGNFTLNIDYETRNWIEKNVNIPCLENGNLKCAFVVSRDVLVHICIIDAFDDIKSCVIPQYFTNEKEARQWFNETSLEINHPLPENKLIYVGIDENGYIILKIPTKNIKHTFKMVYQLLEQEKYVVENSCKNLLLTKREKEILSLIVLGKKHIEIAENLFISLHTVRTHLKNIKTKLNFEQKSDLTIFIKNFYS